MTTNSFCLGFPYRTPLLLILNQRFIFYLGETELKCPFCDEYPSKARQQNVQRFFFPANLLLFLFFLGTKQETISLILQFCVSFMTKLSTKLKTTK